jgi:hypothetical protein
MPLVAMESLLALRAVDLHINWTGFPKRASNSLDLLMRTEKSNTL